MSKRQAVLNEDERGFAAIVIALVLVIVLSLITVGFAQLMRREQRSALDKQLSSQAYYAAESGVNDAQKAVNAGYNKAKTKCESSGSADATDGSVDTNLPGSTFIYNPSPNPATSSIATSTSSSYTCLLLDPTPLTLEYSPVSTDRSKPIIITGVNATNPSAYATIGKIVISWQDTDSSRTNFASVPAAPSNNRPFKTATAWTDTGVLRIGLTPLSSGNIKRDTLIDNTATAFLYPNNTGASTPSYSYGSFIGNNAGAILDGNCRSTYTPRYCNVAITGLNQFNYLLDLRSIYAPTTVTISAYDLSGTQLRILNAQTTVDSTGKASDILRRIQVRIPSKNDYPIPDYSLQTMSNICKQLKLTPTDNTGNNCN